MAAVFRAAPHAAIDARTARERATLCTPPLLCMLRRSRTLPSKPPELPVQKD